MKNTYLGLSFVLLFGLSCTDAPERLRSKGGKNPATVETGDGNPSNPGSPGSKEAVALTCEPNQKRDPGSTSLKRITRAQYLNAVQDLLGAIPNLNKVLSAQVKPSEIGQTLSTVSQVDVEDYQRAAETIAAAFIASSNLKKAIFPCEGTGARECVSKAFLPLAKRALRSPIETADLNRFMAVYDAGSKSNPDHGLEILISTLLQHPRFLYQFEFGGNEPAVGNAVKLSPYEIAGRLAFAVWDSIPNDKLLQAAEKGQLNSPEGIKAQLAWMLESPRGKTLHLRFLEEWAQIDTIDAKAKDSKHFPEWSDAALRNSVKDQARAFFQSVLEKDGSLNELLTSTSVPVNKNLAKVYGWKSESSEMETITGDKTKTSGLLTLPAVLALNASASESSPIYRGRFVRQNLLCQVLPPAPADIPPAPEITEGVSTRERLKQHEVNPSCSGCHVLMDPVGFGFENFDAIGRYRTMESQVPIDASGNLIRAEGIEGNFNGVVELGQKLASSQEVKDCMARLWFRFLMSRFEEKADACTLRNGSDAMKDAGDDIRKIPEVILGSDAFLYRRPIEK